ncbi:MAG: glycosyltransferase [Cellvibrionaceae bacterium]
MKTVHTSNIANVAYENCKILDQFKVEVQLYCHDMTHIMSQPEWDDLDLDSEDFPNENDFYSNSANLGSYKRPEWFHSGTLFSLLLESSNDNQSLEAECGASELIAPLGGHMADANDESAHRDDLLQQDVLATIPISLKLTQILKGTYYTVVAYLSLFCLNTLTILLRPAVRVLPQNLKETTNSCYKYIFEKLHPRTGILQTIQEKKASTESRSGFFTKTIDRGLFRLIPLLRGFPLPVTSALKSAYYRSHKVLFPGAYVSLTRGVSMVVKKSRKYGDEWAIEEKDCENYILHSQWMNIAAKQADVIFTYVLSPIYTLLDHNKPYVAVEIGTMRDIPFEGSARGRLLAAAYREADYVLITNPDVKGRAEELGLKHYDFCPHPIDEARYTPFSGSQRTQMRRELFDVPDDTLVMFAPARQNWAVKGNDKYFRAIQQCVRKGMNVKLVIPGWGQEVDKSKSYCNELGISEYVQWVRPVSEGGLIKYFGSVDIVLDQYELGVFGLITPKALSCGAVVITSYDKLLNDWCFDEHPPLKAASSDQDIFENIAELYFDRSLLRRTAEESRQWVIKEHSKVRVKDTLLRAARIAEKNFAKRI